MILLFITPPYYYGSKQRHFMGVNIKITGDIPPHDTIIQKIAQIDEG